MLPDPGSVVTTKVWWLSRPMAFGKRDVVSLVIRSLRGSCRYLQFCIYI